MVSLFDLYGGAEPPEVLPKILGELADTLYRSGNRAGARACASAAAEIEGHNEAFTQVVADKRGALAEQKRFEQLLRGSHEFIARWRGLLVALRTEYPDDIRIKRALAGEHPMRPAPWETKR